MRYIHRFALLVFASLLISTSSAQQTAATSVPNLIRYGGTLRDAQGTALASSSVGVTFAIYKQQEGGAPVWLETQNVTTDARGNYNVLLGSSTATGLPADLFSQQEQRWLGVQVQGQAEQQRVLLVSVPYAFKASEADKLAGHSASDFVTSDTLQSAVQQQLQQNGASPAIPNDKSAGRPPLTVQGATDFIDTTTNQVVLVLQRGTGPALAASSPGNSAIIATTNAGPQPGIVAGVEGVSSMNTSFGVYGRATSPSGANPGIGVYGQSDSPNGVGVRGVTTDDSTNAIGVFGVAYGAAGTGVAATANATSGKTFGLVATAKSPQGTGILIQNTAGGPLIRGKSEQETIFTVDGGGNVNLVSGSYQIGGASVLNIGGLANNNLFVGAGAGSSTVAGQGQNNTFSGAGAGSSNTIGSSDIFLGQGAGANNINGNYDIYIGNQGPTSGTESNTIRIGTQNPDLQNSAYIAGIYNANVGAGTAVYINAEGQLGTLTSSRRFKEQIADMGDSSSRLLKLRPVTFFYKPEYDKGLRTLQYGLIAEEVAKVYPELVAYDRDGQPFTVRYQYLATMLLNEAQKQYHKIENQQQTIEELRTENQKNRQRVEQLEQRLSRLESLIGTPVMPDAHDSAQAVIGNGQAQ